MCCPCPQGGDCLGEKTDMPANSCNSGREFLTVVPAKQQGSTEEEVSGYLATKLGPNGKMRTQQKKAWEFQIEGIAELSPNTET